MVRPEDIPGLLAGETDRIEFKQSSGQRDPILRSVCALANDLGASGTTGHLIIGVDKSGNVVGVGAAGDLDRQQREISDWIRSSKIQPVPAASIEICSHAGHALILIAVDPYPVPPIVQVDGVAWVRVGSTTRRATQADLQRLQERRPDRSIPFDSRPLAEATLGHLVQARLREAWEAGRIADEDPATFPDFEAWLLQRQLGRKIGGVLVPNAAAVLVYGQSPQTLLPAAWIDMVRYTGRDVDSPVASRRPCTGSLVDQLDVAWAWISAHIENVPQGVSGIREAFVPAYPVEALKELVRNLVQHRLYEGTNAPGRIEWFDDRIEFSNPGGPYGRASEGEFGSHSDYRNPLVTARLVEAGYVQQLGRGIRRVRLQLERNSNPPLEVTTDGFTRIVVRRKP